MNLIFPQTRTMQQTSDSSTMGSTIIIPANISFYFSGYGVGYATLVNCNDEHYYLGWPIYIYLPIFKTWRMPDGLVSILFVLFDCCEWKIVKLSSKFKYAVKRDVTWSSNNKYRKKRPSVQCAMCMCACSPCRFHFHAFLSMALRCILSKQNLY